MRSQKTYKNENYNKGHKNAYQTGPTKSLNFMQHYDIIDDINI